jgi:hypothetical protein
MKIKPWDRQPGETKKSYECFCIYRDLGEGRSLYDAWLLYRNKNGMKTEHLANTRKPDRQIELWSSKWKWVERCNEYDEYLERIARAEAEKIRLEKIKQHKEDLARIAEQGLRNTRALVSIVGVELKRRADNIQKGDIKAIPNRDLVGLITATNSGTKQSYDLLQNLYPDDFSSKININLVIEEQLREEFPGIEMEHIVAQIKRVIMEKMERIHDGEGGTNDNGNH